jgi:hypothetical protein
MLNLGDHASRSVPGGGLVLKAPIPDQRRVAGPTTWSGEQILDASLQDVVGREADCVPHPSAFQGFVKGGQGKGRVRADDNGLPSCVVPINDGKEDLVPSVRTVDVAWAEFGREAVALRVEDEERVIANGLEVAIVGGLLLGSVGSPSCRYRESPSGSSIGPTRAGSVPY